MREGKSGLLIHLILFWISFVCLFEEKVVFYVETGGRGIVPVLLLLTPVLVTIVIINSKGQALLFVKNLYFWVFWAPYLICTLTFPFLGILIIGYPSRTILTSLQSIVAVSFIILGFWIRIKISDDKWRSLFGRYILWGIFVQFIFVFGQYLFRIGYISENLGILLYMRDPNSLFDSEVIWGRSVGLYSNPNILGFWAVFLLIMSFYLVNSRLRFYSIVMSVMVLILSQSRGAMFAGLSCVLWGATYWIMFRRRINIKSFIVSIAGLVITIATVWSLYRLGYLEESFIDRLENGLGVVALNFDSDQNFAGRVQAWRAGFEFFPKYPFGTLGSPEYLFESFIDNDWVRVILQGGPVYFISLIFMLTGGFLIGRNLLEGKLMAVLSISIAVAAITQTPLLYPPMVFYWFILGSYFGNVVKISQGFDRDHKNKQLQIGGK